MSVCVHLALMYFAIAHISKCVWYSRAYTIGLLPEGAEIINDSGKYEAVERERERGRENFETMNKQRQAGSFSFCIFFFFLRSFRCVAPHVCAVVVSWRFSLGHAMCALGVKVCVCVCVVVRVHRRARMRDQYMHP